MYIEIKEYGSIYKLTNKINNKIYFGQTTNFIRRYNEYKNRKVYQSNKYNTPITRAIEKYGFSNFKIEVVDIAFSKQELEIKEKYYITKFKSNNPEIGYNSKIGSGKGETLNVVTRRKMSEAHTGLKETGATKKKKSKGIIAYRDGELIISDSAKLFADYIQRSRSEVSAGKNKCIRVSGYFIFALDYDERNKKESKFKDYNIARDIVNKGVETKENQKFIYLSYSDE